jgi:hypothetical protein
LSGGRVWVLLSASRPYQSPLQFGVFSDWRFLLVACSL